LCGILVGYLGQPQVIGEILAGIFLGPSLLKIVAPEVHAFLFPQGSVQRLYFLSPKIFTMMAGPIVRLLKPQPVG
jgi:Kef-type K+ transport system membrane component KefB